MCASRFRTSLCFFFLSLFKPLNLATTLFSSALRAQCYCVQQESSSAIFTDLCVFFSPLFSVFLCPPLWTHFRLSFKIEQSNGFLYNIVASICAWRTCPMQTNAIFAFFSFYSFALFISNVFKINQRITIVFVLFRFRKIIRQRN